MQQLLWRLICALFSFLKTWTMAVLRSFHNGGILTEQDLRSHRMQICTKCPDYQYDLDMCSICFCKMSIKTALIESECPVKKW